MCLSTLATATIEEVAAAAPEAARWFQLYWSSDRGVVRDFVERAAAAGYGAVMLTVDLPALGRRERDLRTGFEIPGGRARPRASRPGRGRRRDAGRHQFPWSTTR